MSNELLMALSVGLLPISAVNLWQAARYHYYRRHDSKNELNDFVSGLLFWQIAIFISCILYLLWDFDVITKAMQYKLSLMPRCFFLIGSLFFYKGLNLGGNSQDYHLIVVTILLVIMLAFSMGVII